MGSGWVPGNGSLSEGWGRRRGKGRLTGHACESRKEVWGGDVPRATTAHLTRCENRWAGDRLDGGLGTGDDPTVGPLSASYITAVAGWSATDCGSATAEESAAARDAELASSAAAVPESVDGRAPSFS